RPHGADLVIRISRGSLEVRPMSRNSKKAPVRTRRAPWRSVIALAGLGLLGAGGTDCAQQRAPIDQRQPGGLQKSFFVGANLRGAADDPEFYVNNYVVDAPASQSLVPVGTYDQVDRIRWEIQENYLLARA